MIRRTALLCLALAVPLLAAGGCDHLFGGQPDAGGAPMTQAPDPDVFGPVTGGCDWMDGQMARLNDVCHAAYWGDMAARRKCVRYDDAAALAQGLHSIGDAFNAQNASTKSIWQAYMACAAKQLTDAGMPERVIVVDEPQSQFGDNQPIAFVDDQDGTVARLVKTGCIDPHAAYYGVAAPWSACADDNVRTQCFPPTAFLLTDPQAGSVCFRSDELLKVVQCPVCGQIVSCRWANDSMMELIEPHLSPWSDEYCRGSGASCAGLQYNPAVDVCMPRPAAPSPQPAVGSACALAGGDKTFVCPFGHGASDPKYVCGQKVHCLNGVIEPHVFQGRLGNPMCPMTGAPECYGPFPADGGVLAVDLGAPHPPDLGAPPHPPEDAGARADGGDCPQRDIYPFQIGDEVRSCAVSGACPYCGNGPMECDPLGRIPYHEEYPGRACPFSGTPCPRDWTTGTTGFSLCERWHPEAHDGGDVWSPPDGGVHLCAQAACPVCGKSVACTNGRLAWHTYPNRSIQCPGSGGKC